MTGNADKELRFSIFGTDIVIVGAPGKWSALIPGADGKRRPAEFIVPDYLAEDELCQYLADLLHESATPANGKAFRIK